MITLFHPSTGRSMKFRSLADLLEGLVRNPDCWAVVLSAQRDELLGALYEGFPVDEADCAIVCANRIFDCGSPERGKSLFVSLLEAKSCDAVESISKKIDEHNAQSKDHSSAGKSKMANLGYDGSGIAVGKETSGYGAPHYKNLSGKEITQILTENREHHKNLSQILTENREHLPAPGTVGEITLPIGKMEMVYCPPGAFNMGSPLDEKGRGYDERQHTVILENGFWIGKFPVTQSEWKKVMGDNPAHFQMFGEESPVESVSWEDCQEFCRELSRYTRLDVRLPSEAEWEYACRASRSRGRYYAEARLKELAWRVRDEPYACGTQPVGCLKANDWGLFDMLGNVWEWCQDWYGAYPENIVVNPQGPDEGQFKVLRGGCWKSSSASQCRCATRWYRSPNAKSYAYGFRIVCDEIA